MVCKLCQDGKLPARTLKRLKKKGLCADCKKPLVIYDVPQNRFEEAFNIAVLKR